MLHSNAKKEKKTQKIAKLSALHANAKSKSKSVRGRNA